MSSLLLLLASPLSSYILPYAEAAEYGAVRGEIVDEQGIAVPDAVVTLSGSDIAGEMKVQTDANGQYRFLNVPLGTHTVVVTRARFATTRTTVTVRLGETVYLPFTLKIESTAGMEIVVEGEAAVVDATQSGFSNNISREMLDNLPTGRTYQDAVNMLPGVYGNVDTSEGGAGDGNPSVRGEGQYGNNFLVDGVSTRDPATKTFGMNVNFDAIEEIQVYTDGAPAEYGQFTGMLVNVVTKDGGDEHHGTAGLFVNTTASGGTYPIVDLETHTEVETEKLQSMAFQFSGTAGGPIVKEKLWYFTALDLDLERTQFPGMPEDQPYSTRGGQGWAKLTWFATPSLTVRGSFSGSGDLTTNRETTVQYVAAQSKRQSGDYNGLLTVNWLVSAKGELEVGAGTLLSSIDSAPMSGDEDSPSFLNLDTGEYSGNYTDFDYNKRSRMGGFLNYTQLVDKALGSHRIKTGLEFYRLTDRRELVYTGPGDGISYYTRPSLGLECATPIENAAAGEPAYSDCYGYQTFQSVGGVQHLGLTGAFFLQDDWELIDRLTLNLGVRVDQETLFADRTTAEALIDQIMPAPRAGVAWDVTGDSKTLVSANYGRYYDLTGNTFAVWGDTRSAYAYSYYRYNTGTGEYDFIFSQDPELSPSVYDEDLRPAHMDKVTLAVEREVVPLLAVGLRGMMSKTVDIPEDINVDDYTYLITNPEAGTKYRTYRGVELTVERKFDDHWQVLASYTLSESKGHTPGQFDLPPGASSGSDGNGVGVYLDDINDPAVRQALLDAGLGAYLDGYSGMGTETDDAGYFGYMPYHSFHMVKVNGSYTANFGTTFGMVYTFDSGHAWEKRTYIPNYFDYFGYGEGRGSRFMPAAHYIDIRVAHAFTFQEERKLELAVDVFNVPDLQTPITYYSNDDENFGLTLYRQTPRAVQVGVKYVY